MMQTLSKHIKWRKDQRDIFICDCKRLIDLKLPLKYESFMKRLDRGIDKNSLTDEEKKVFSDFEKTKLISRLKIRQINKKEFNNAMKILDNELGKNRVRDKKFLSKKFKKNRKFFIGIFLDKEIIGVICGFPREDYLLISEIAIDKKFQNKGFGKKLVKKFEEVSKGEYRQIHVGAKDKAIQFYTSLGYKPFLLIQFEKEDYTPQDFEKFEIVRSSPTMVEINIEKVDLKFLKKLKKKYPKAWFQYIFTNF